VSIFDLTFIQALNLGGNSAGNSICPAAGFLLRAAAAVLNSGSVSFPLTLNQIKSEVNAALISCDLKKVLAEQNRLDGFNNLGCPLDSGSCKTALVPFRS
jgi:hypothetical protein